MALSLGDYAGGDWYFIVRCKACGREKTLEPAELLSRPETRKVHRGMRVEDLKPLLCCRECGRREAHIEPVARTRRQGFVGGMI